MTWRRGLLAAVLVAWPVVVTAQVSPLVPPVFIQPASAVNGAGTATTSIKLTAGTAAAPSLTFAADATKGFYSAAANQIGVAIGGALSVTFGADTLYFGASKDAILTREDAAIVQLGVDAAGVTNQTIKGPDRITSDGVGGTLTIAGGRNRGASVGGAIAFQTSPAAGAGVAGTLATRLTIDDTGAVSPTNAAITAGANATLVTPGDLRHVVYKATVTASSCVAPFKAAALTADCTIAQLPAKTRLLGIYADVTAAFTCSGTCTGTKTIGAGTTAGGVEILAAGLNVAATGQLGLIDADLGTGMVAAARIQGAYLPSWTAATDVIVRFTSGTGNWGDASVTFVNAGSVTFYLITERLP